MTTASLTNAITAEGLATVLFPVTFISNVFVPLQSLPSWLQPFRTLGIRRYRSLSR